MAHRRLAAVALATLALAGPVAAQTAPPAGPTSGPTSGPPTQHDHRGAGRGWGWDGGQDREAMRARGEARRRQVAADLALVLRLRPDQQPAYEAWRTALHPASEREHKPGEGWGRHGPGRDGPGRDGPGRDGDAAAPSSTLQALDWMQARMAEHEAHARTRLDATRRFYAALSPDQQQAFDALMRLRHAHGGGHGRWGGHGMGGGMEGRMKGGAAGEG